MNKHHPFALLLLLLGLGSAPSRLLAQTTVPDSATRPSAAATLPSCEVDPDPPACRRIRVLADSAEVYRRSGNRAAEGRVLSRVGQLLIAAGAPDSASLYYSRAIEAKRAAGDVEGSDSARRQMRLAQRMGLLQRAPVLEPTMGVVAGQLYIRDTRLALADELDPAALEEIRSPEDATRALEASLGGIVVQAKVRSQPSRIVVRYRRLIDPPGAERSVTTDDDIQLPPALYLFEARHPVSGKVQEQRKSCATPCNVQFVFAPGDRGR